MFDEFDVLASNDSRAVFELIADFKPDIIMLDLILGFDDGAKICQKIKQHLVFKAIPVVPMTAGFPKERDNYVGADAFIENHLIRKNAYPF